MDPRLLRYYNQELRYLREMGGEFAREFPKIAGRLGMEGMEVADPYVERLLEGCAFLAARVQLKQDAEFPYLSQHLLEMVSPNFTAPVPSMLVARLQPLAQDPNLLGGFRLPRGTVLLGPQTAMGPTRCEFRTAQELTLTPLSVTAVEYFLSAADLPLSTLPLPEKPRSGVRVRLELPAGASFAQLRVPSLRFFLGGLPDVALRLHELLLGACVGVLVGAPARGGEARREFLPGDVVEAVGYDDADAMLPVTLRGLSGTRLMQEYFGFPQRFLFIDVGGLLPAFQRCSGNVCELVMLFDRFVPSLEGGGDPDNFMLHCVPAVNLFERRAERITPDDTHTAYQVIPERTQPNDYETYDVAGVTGFSESSDQLDFLPLFAVPQADPGGARGFYTVHREPRLASDRARREGPRSAYVGMDTYVTLVDLQHAPLRENVRQLAARVRCTNRDLPLFMPLGQGQGDFTLGVGAPIDGIEVVAGPSRPHSALHDGAIAWRLLSLLSLNYLALLDEDAEKGALALRELLGLYSQAADVGLKRQIDGVRSVKVSPIVRRHPTPGPIAFARGVSIRLLVDELAFEGGSAVLLGSVLHHHFARHVSMNSFAQTVLASMTRGELVTWEPRLGTRPIV